MQPERELAYWPEFPIEVFFLVIDYGAHTNCLVRARNSEMATKVYLEWKGIHNYANLFEAFYHDCNCHLTEMRPRTVQQQLSNEQLNQLHRNSIVCWGVSA